MTRQLDWAGQPILPGQGYGGRPENIPETLGQKSALAAAKENQHFAIITKEALSQVFGNGAYKLTRAEAAKLLELLTDCHRTTCYRALRLNGRFARHLHSDGTMLCWR
jgi:hypothetical protein